MTAKTENNTNTLKQLIQDLADGDSRKRFAASYKLKLRIEELAEFAQPLQEIAINHQSPSRPAALYLLRLLGEETTRRWGDKNSNIICPTCLVNFCTYEVNIPYETVVYYACSNCGQSQDVLATEGSIAVLDNQMKERYIQDSNIIRINWMLMRKLSYFDQGEIIRANDEEVERFAVQIGNDTDESRKAHNRQMKCLVAADCNLSENTKRILKHSFSQIETID